ncbi:hypothetical protein [Teredinibacter turnerae]|uniref:hypothetical protein n=1 Tax=Teredinibacter turnerae TaxID=2426 RepID=UPI000361A503|nr:hypothetical protein [Teredinibacter turnerae]
MDKKELLRLIPENGGGIEGITVLKGIGYPALKPITKSLMNNLERTPFPANEIDSVIVEILSDGGSSIVEEVEIALTVPRSPQKKFVLISQILPNWSTEELKPIEGAIYNLVEGFSFHGIDVWAIKLLIEKGLDGHTEPLKWLEFKKENYAQKIEVLNGIRIP